MTSMLAGAVRREPLVAVDGRSGSLLERVVLAGGRVLDVAAGPEPARGGRA